MIEHIFETPLYWNNTVDRVNAPSINDEIGSIIDQIDFIDCAEDIGKFSVSSNTFFSNILDTYNLKSTSHEIDRHIREYCSQLNFTFKSYTMVSWFIKMNKGDYVHFHNHLPTEMSGVYYYKASGDDAKIVFECPHHMLDTSKVYHCVSPRWEHYAETGKIIIFPSWLRHGVQTQKSDETRIGLSFNITFNV